MIKSNDNKISIEIQYFFFIYSIFFKILLAKQLLFKSTFLQLNVNMLIYVYNYHHYIITSYSIISIIYTKLL